MEDTAFSWQFANKNPNFITNVTYGGAFKLLIPLPFGGGSIEDRYQGSGLLGRRSKPANADDLPAKGEARFDIYELLAFWNTANPQDTLLWPGKADGVPAPRLKEIDEFTDKNREVGIRIAGSDELMGNLRYPLKLVTPEFPGTYEMCPGFSRADPYDGWIQHYEVPPIPPAAQPPQDPLARLDVMIDGLAVRQKEIRLSIQEEKKLLSDLNGIQRQLSSIRRATSFARKLGWKQGSGGAR